ncbi:DUF416 family protein [Anaeromyxobacter oryzisoli]|uniref:DUF416 family protein n=1 Tax=Anaeromyxobacter oryzisoli TaxID=2925408 RepID=UPI001F59715B|nr:DUF416 family protein [Anaeromyxobacter sp. SG63]
MLTYDRSALEKRLAGIPERLRVLFAAAVAERLFPHAERFFRARDPETSDRLHEALELLWKYGGGDREEDAEREDALLACETSIRTAADEGTDDALFAENAAAAIAYGLRAMRSSDPREPGWAAERAYDTVDYFVLMEDADRGVEWSEEQILSHTVVQRELQRQRDDIAALEAMAANGGRDEGEIGRLRDNARAQALSIFLERPDR